MKLEQFDLLNYTKFFPSKLKLLFLLNILGVLHLQAQVGIALLGSKSPSITNTGANIVGSSGSYWVVSNGSFTLVSPFAVNAATMDNLTIAPGGSLTLTPATCLTVIETLANNNTSETGIRVKSDSTGTGSLITAAASPSGTATAARWMSAGKWNLVSAPITQTVSAFLAANRAIETSGALRAMMDYNPGKNNWNPFFTTGAGDGALTDGRGFAMHIGPANTAVTFTGSLQAGTVTATGLTPGSWNCVGNPYTSAIGINAASSAVNDFLTVNLGATPNIDPSFGAIYIWEQPDASNNQTGGYTVISNVPLISPAFNIQQGQAFMIKTNTNATSVDFNHDMQLHIPNLALKSSAISWPVIQLSATVNSQKSTTYLAFNDQMSKGLDPTYDVGMLNTNAPLSVYTRLVEDNGVPFVIQSLPGSSISKYVIPVGLESAAGGEVIFSAKTISLSSDCKVILEDKAAKTYTDLQAGVYKATIAANSPITDRFLLHTSAETIRNLSVLPNELNAYVFENMEIHIRGTVTGQAVATLFDALGRVVLTNKLNEGDFNSIPIPGMSSGIYVLKVVDQGVMHPFKLLIKQ